MPKKRILSPQSVWDSDALATAFEAEGVKSQVHIPKLYNYLCRHPECRDLSEAADILVLPKAAKAILDSQFVACTTQILDKQVAADGETVKLLVRLQDGLQVESVIMHYDTTTRYDGLETGQGRKRATLCVSSEVGCQMGCTFCATGTMGLTADLTAAEIVEQLLHASSVTSITNVVFMGMGEPLNNYTAVKSAVSIMIHPQYFHLKKSAVTVSTVGVIPRILSLAQDLPGVSLALSLHAPTQELRQTIVPSAKAYKLDKLMAAVDGYIETTGQKIFIEYVMLGPDVNCTLDHARQLGELLKSRKEHISAVNLIPWNPILSPGMDFDAPLAGSTMAFKDLLKEEFGIPATVRQEKGQDVAAACGQLVLEKGGRCTSGSVKDVEDLAVSVCSSGR